jgi:hypothetical protein
MVFRDYVQGAYRMRGIGQGQKIHIFIIPEVKELIQRELRDCIFTCPDSVNAKDTEDPTGSGSTSDRTKGFIDGSSAKSGSVVTTGCSIQSTYDHVLEDVVAWLIINSLRSEQTQWTMLCVQNISNLYRKNAFKCLTKYMNYFIEGSIAGNAKSLALSNKFGPRQSSEIDSASPKPALGTLSATKEFLFGPSSESSKGLTLNITPIHYDPSPIKMVRSLTSALAEETFVSALDKRQSLEMFNETIDFALDAGVPDPVPFADKLKSMLEENEAFLLPPQHELGNM